MKYLRSWSPRALALMGVGLVLIVISASILAAVFASPKGALDPTLAAAIRATTAEVRTSCYEPALKATPGLRQRAWAEFRIEPDGRLVDVHASGISPASPQVEDCVTSVVERQVFPSRVSALHLRVPMVFAPR